MEEQTKILKHFNIPTIALKSDILKSLLVSLKKLKHNGQGSQLFWKELSESLWLHLHSGISLFDDQLLCSTCFYTVLEFNEDKLILLQKVLDFIESYYRCKYSNDIIESKKTEITLSLMYGIFQSAFLVNVESERTIITEILIVIFNLSVMMAYEYTNYTFLVFKILNYFKKLNINYSTQLLNDNRQKILLNVVTNNWENPIAGIRDLNKSIFGFLCTLFDQNLYLKVLTDINDFQWNKAKYLMLSEIIIQHSQTIDNLFSEHPDWIEGLINSLFSTGLVSAGTDMYNAVLTKMKTENEWCITLISKVINILNGKSMRAIDNFSNYWCLMTFKKFPTLFGIIFREMESINLSGGMYGVISVMKQANRLGILNKLYPDVIQHEPFLNLILVGLVDCDAHVRMITFEIICTCNSTSMPNESEFDLVYTFLVENINSDVTILRISMLNSLKLFLNRIHNTFVNKPRSSNIQIDPTMKCFFINIQKLVTMSLDFTNANYQRRSTSIKICDIIWTCLTTAKIKKQHDNKACKRKNLVQILDQDGVWLLNADTFILKLFKMLQDSSDDIRDNLVNILLKHYNNMLIGSEYINKLIEDALTCIESKFFYEINCGHSIIKLVANLLLKNNYDGSKFKEIESLFIHVFDKLLTEHRHIRHGKNIVHSIEKGKQLHALINVLITIIKVCLQNSYCMTNILKECQCNELLDLLHDISTQFALNEVGTISSDFSNINDMVENMIKESGYNASNDKTKISGLHQIVLNCMWLNVKASCDMCTVLIMSQNDLSFINTDRCLDIIAQVLETSRHKGAIEAAGVALGEAVQYLTSLPDESSLSKLPYILLKRNLCQIKETNRMASVTRRGAGLSIMVHKIVSNDKQKGKPLFHYFMRTILTTYTSEEQPTNVFTSKNEKDLPEAIYIHFLTRVVTDSSLQPDIMFYAASLGELAFKNLTNKDWQIRNAALQLYGALVPKLLGQKKSHECREEAIATVGCEEFRMHSPKLWDYINEQLRFKGSDIIQIHSNLVPVLNLLAHTAKKYNFFDDMVQLGVHYSSVDSNEILIILMKLLNSPIYVVRNLVSKSIYLNYSLEIVLQNIDLQNINIAENSLHGYLLLTEHYHKFYHQNHLEKNNFYLLEVYFKRIMNNGNHSYLCKKLYNEMFLNVNIGNTTERIIEAFQELHSNKNEPGIYSWINVILSKYIFASSWHLIPQILEITLREHDYEIYCEYLLEKIKFVDHIPTEVSLQIVNLFLLFGGKWSSNVIWRILYEISLKADLSNCVHLDCVFMYLERNMYAVPYKLRYLIPFACNIVKYLKNITYILHLSYAIWHLVSSDTIDVDMRYIAAQALNEFGVTLGDLPEEIKVNLLKTLIILLQDEDEDVRNKSTIFVKLGLQEHNTLQPYVCLNKIVSTAFLKSIFEDPAHIKSLCNDLMVILDKSGLSCDKNSDYNPFSNDVRNIYFETDVLQKLICEVTQNM